MIGEPIGVGLRQSAGSGSPPGRRVGPRAALPLADALTEAVYNSDVIDEDELYEEFRLLELECDNKSHSPRNLDVKVDFPSGKEVVDEPTQSPVTDEKPQKSTSKPNSDEASPMPS